MKRSSIQVLRWILISVMASLLVLPAGCGERQVESGGWKPPSGVATRGSFDHSAPAEATGPFIAYVKGGTSKPYRYGISTVPAGGIRKYYQETNTHQLTSGSWDDYPTVSPDGETIVYEHSEGDPFDFWESVQNPDGSWSTVDACPPSVGIFAIPSRGGEPRQITPASWMTDTGWTPLMEIKPETIWFKRDCIMPSYSQDGEKLCFVISDTTDWDGSSALATVSADGVGEPEILLIPEDGGVSHPKYSPDGQYIYFCSCGGIKMMPAEGGTVTWVIQPHELESRRGSSGLFSAIPLALPGLCAGEEDESETPDIVTYKAFDFIREPPGLAAVELWGAALDGWHTQIVLMGMDGSDPRPLYGGSDSIAVRPYRISVSPDGKLIAFSNGGYGGGNQGPVYVLDLENLQATVIADGDHPCFGEWAAKSQ